MVHIVEDGEAIRPSARKSFGEALGSQPQRNATRRVRGCFRARATLGSACERAQLGDSEGQLAAIALDQSDQTPFRDWLRLKAGHDRALRFVNSGNEAPSPVQTMDITAQLGLTGPHSPHRRPFRRSGDGLLVNFAVFTKRQAQQICAARRTAREFPGAIKLQANGLPTHAAVLTGIGR